jgi:hypothetical protein
MATFVLLIIGTVLAGLGAGVLAVVALVFLFTKKKRPAAVCGILAVVSLAACVGLGIGTIVRGVGKVSDRWREQTQLRENRRDEHVERLRSYVDPGKLANVPEDYYTDTGAFDAWRFPLVWPYEMEGADHFDTGLLESYNNLGAVRVTDVTHVAFDGDWLLLRTEPSFGGTGPVARARWFLMSFEDETIEEYDSREALFEAAEEAGYTGPDQLDTLEEAYDRFTGEAE